jgi:hypothetical protein
MKLDLLKGGYEEDDEIKSSSTDDKEGMKLDLLKGGYEEDDEIKSSSTDDKEGMKLELLKMYLGFMYF